MGFGKRNALSAVLLTIILLALGCSKQKHPESLTIAFSNDTEGRIRSCGCPVNDIGGLGRRATFVKAVRDTAEDFLLLDGGDFFGTELNYGKEKADVTMKAMAIMKYDGVVLGEKDLGFGMEYIRERAKKIGVPVLLANVYDAKTDSLLFAAGKILVLPSGLRVGLVGVLGEKIHLPPQVPSGSLVVRSSAASVREAIKQFQGKVDLTVVLAHMGILEAGRLAKKIDGIDVIVCGHKGRPMRKVRKFNGAYILQVPREGKYMGLAYAVLDKNRKIRSLHVQREPMSGLYKDDEAVVKLFQAYDINITLKERSSLPTAVLKPEQAVRKPYVTAEKCGECHKEVFKAWKTSLHASAFNVLVKKSRDYDRDCTPCHTTGFYAVGGFVNADATPELINVQCEACHGNGYDHSHNPKKKTKDDAKQVCKSCHNAQQSPKFDFQTFWPKISH